MSTIRAGIEALALLTRRATPGLSRHHSPPQGALTALPLFAWLSLLLTLTFPAPAAPPPPGTEIVNRATIEFLPGSEPIQFQSDPVRVIVAGDPGPDDSLSLSEGRNLALNAGTTAFIPHQLLYLGAGPASVTVSFENAGAGDDYDLADLRAYHDLNTNGVADAGEPLVANGSSLTVRPGEPLYLVVAGELPASPLLAGRVALVRLGALVPGSDLSAANESRITLLAVTGSLFTQISASRQRVEIGDTVRFTITVRNATGLDLEGVRVTNNLPAGFAYEKGTAELDGVATPDPQGRAGPQLVFEVGSLANDAIVSITHVVRARPGAQKGDGVSQAWASSAEPRVFRSNVATVQLDVTQDGVFTDAGVVLGKVFIDANQNREQDPMELGIPGIRIYLEDGTYVITDSEGKYSLYGLSPRTHILKLDETTLPPGAELLAPTTRHAGSGGTRFVDINRGELHKANFTVGYATPEFVDTVKRRRLEAQLRASEIDTMIKGRLTPDGQPLLTGDPRSLPASGVVGAPPTAGPDLTSGLVPQSAQRASTAPNHSLTNSPALPALSGNGIAEAADAELAAGMSELATNDLAFLRLKDGDVLPTAQATLRVCGAQGARLLLRVNGQEVPASRLGRRAVLAEKKLELWEYVGVPLQAGANRLELIQFDPFGNERGRRAITVTAPDKPGKIRLIAPADDPVADGKTPAKFVVEVTDAEGVPVTARLPLTLESSLGEWTAEDLDRREPGTQVFLEGGRGEFQLVAPMEPGEAQVRVSSGALEAETRVGFLPELRPMLAAGVIEGTLNLSDVDARSLFPPRSQDGFAEELQAFALNSDTGTARYGGRAAFFLKGKILGKYLLTAGYDSDKEERERLFRDIQPDEFYPVYGDSSVRGFDAQSTGRLYVRVDHNRCYILYGDFITMTASEARSLGNYSRSLTGGRVHLEDQRVSVNLWASEDSSRQVIDEIRGNGTSGPYTFSQRNGILNSEKVEIITRDRHQPSYVLKSETLTRFTDYEFEPFTGRILFRRPIPSLDASLNPIFIRITYEVDQGGDKFWVYGADAQAKVTERWELGGAAVRDSNPLGSYGLYSANTTVKLASKTFIFGEYAYSDTELQDGTAGRVELRHQDQRTDARVYYGQAGTTFSNSAAMIASGRIEAGAQVSYRVAANTRLVGQAIDSESLANNGRRVGGTLSVEQTLPGNIRLEVGGRHSTETAAPASESTAATTGVKHNDVTSVRGKLTVPVPYVKNASVYGELENDVIEAGKRLVAAGGEYQLTAKSRLYARHEFINALGGPFELNNFQEQNTTVFGLDTEYIKDGSVFSEYRGRDAFAGRETEAAIGLRNGWNVAEGLRLHTTFERVNPIAGGGQNEATAGAAAVEYTRNPEWKGTARLEIRTSPSSDSLLNTLGYARKVSSDWTFLGKTIFYGVSGSEGGAADKTQARLQAGMAYRQTQTDRWHALMKYEYKFEDDETQPDLDLQRHVHIASFHANYHPTRDWILSGHYATKVAFENAAGADDVYSAHLVALRVTYDLTKRWDVGFNSSVLFDGSFRSAQFGFGPEIGWTFINNMRIAAGFNFFGFRDADLAAQDYTNPGFFLSFRFKFDETLFGLGNNSKERSAP